MNDLGVLLLGGIARVTAFAALGVVLAIVLKRRGPAVGTLLTLTTLSGLVVVSILSIGPGPTLWTLKIPIPKTAAPKAAIQSPTPVEPTLAQGPKESFYLVFAREFAREWGAGNSAPKKIQRSNSPEPSPWKLPGWLALAILATWTFAILRLALALLAVRRLCRASELIVDQALGEEIDILRAELCIAKPVETRVCAALTTPATVGWLKPVILLPNDWREWRANDRKAVLAHEFAHIQRGDYISGLWAQFCLALHAYHPLAHWLVSRLRLEQELAADAAGAALTGGNRPYLESLARLALRQSEPPTAWPVRPFLPTRGTFLRRIEMLRDPKALQNKPVGATGRAFAIALLSAAALGLAGLRGPGAASAAAEAKLPSENALAAPLSANPEQAGNFADVFDLSHVPANVSAVVLMRPADALKRPEFEPFVKVMKESQAAGRPGSLDVAVEEIEALAAYGKLIADPNAPPVEPFTTLIRTTVPQDWKKATRHFIDNPEAVDYKGRTYVKAKGTTDRTVYATFGDRTLLFGPEASVKEILIAQTVPKISHVWDQSWSKLSDKPWVVAMTLYTKDVDTTLARAAQGNPTASIVGPLFAEATAYSMSFKLLDNGTELRVEASADSAESATRVHETAGAMLVLAKNSIADSRRKPAAKPNPGTQPMRALFDLAEPLVKGAKLTTEGSNVSLVAKSNTNLEAIVQTLLPAAIASRTAARRSESMNHVKQIGLAMHNYYATYDHFPAASITAPGSKFPHSWRVAILPYLDANDLYKEYDLNEPWDSPKNLKLVAKMPRVYAHPNADATSGHTAYRVFTGPGTIFPPGGQGIEFKKITDGTSNTILAIESAGETPWTKPEDIDFDPKNFPGAALPDLKTFGEDGFVTVFADGSARFIKKSIDPGVLKALISMAGGELIGNE